MRTVSDSQALRNNRPEEIIEDKRLEHFKKLLSIKRYHNDKLVFQGCFTARRYDLMKAIQVGISSLSIFAASDSLAIGALRASSWNQPANRVGLISLNILA